MGMLIASERRFICIPPDDGGFENIYINFGVAAEAAPARL